MCHHIRNGWWPDQKDQLHRTDATIGADLFIFENPITLMSILTFSEEEPRFEICVRMGNVHDPDDSEPILVEQ